MKYSTLYVLVAAFLASACMDDDLNFRVDLPAEAMPDLHAGLNYWYPHGISLRGGESLITTDDSMFPFEGNTHTDCDLISECVYTITVGPGTIWGSCLAETLFAHELGHVLGNEHATEWENVMNAGLNVCLP